MSHSYATLRAASLEPLAIEPLQVGTFTYTIADTETKLLLASWQTRVGNAGRLERRDPTGILPLCGVTVSGIPGVSGSDGSIAAFVDPSLPQYLASGSAAYEMRCELLASTPTKVCALEGEGFFPLLPGPYGSIITHTTTFDYAWIAWDTGVQYSGGATCLPLTDETGDGGTRQRVTRSVPIPVSKVLGGGIRAGYGWTGSTGPRGSVAYIVCDADWGCVPDDTVYLFRDDFMRMDSSVWSTAGSIAHNADFGWARVKGDGTWGHTGAFTQQSFIREPGMSLTFDVFTGDGQGALGGQKSPNLIVGWSDGAGHDAANILHGLDFSETATRGIFVLERGINRMRFGDYALNTIYRVRVTLLAHGANYEIQGGNYARIGGAQWSNLTTVLTPPGVASELRAGFVMQSPSTVHVGDVRVC